MVCLLQWIVVCTSRTGIADPANDFTNVAGAYKCVTMPDYWGWKNPQHGDLGQLTDGKIVEHWQTDQGPIYALRSSMGWSEKPPVLLFDLGEVRSIGGLGLHSVMSPWGPMWPQEVTVLVSEDNQRFFLAGPTIKVTPDKLVPPLTNEIVQAGLDRELGKRGHQASTHWYRAGKLQTQGRYLALIMTSSLMNGPVVLDEVEIYAGPASTKTNLRIGPAFTEGEGGWKSYKLHRAINERIGRDGAALRRKIAGSSVPRQTQESLLTELSELVSKVGKQPVPDVAGFRAVLPISDLHARVFQMHAALWRAQGALPLRVWRTHRWDPLSPLQEPAGQPPHLHVVLPQNATYSDVLNLSNAAEQSCTVNITLKDLPIEQIDVCQVEWVDTQAFEPVASALVPIQPTDGVYRVTIPSGMTRQVWLRCRSKNLQAQRREGQIVVTTADPPIVTVVPTILEVLPVRLPEQRSLYVGGWDYSFPGTYQVTEKNLAQYVTILQDYGVNVTWAAGAMPLGSYDANDVLTSPPSREQVDQWLARWPNAGMYCVTVDASASEAKLAAWAKDWSTYLQERGVPPEKVALLIRDEPISTGELETILRVGRAVKQASPGFKIFNDIHFADPTQAPPVLNAVMRDACDIQCFNVGQFFQQREGQTAFMQKHARPGLQWWCYTGGQADRLSDPYVAWLLRPWFCFANNLAGAQWWAFGDGNGGFSWNEYLNNGPSRSPLYLAEDSVVASKSTEAMREGAQDYELLLMLKQALSGLQHADSDGQRLLNDGVERVLKAHNLDEWAWNAPKDRSIADQVRTEVLRCLSRLAATVP